MTWGYQGYLNREIARLDDEISKFSLQIPVQEQENIVNFYSQIVNLQTLLDSSVSYSGFLQWLGDNTDTSVFLNDLAFDRNMNILTISGQAKTLANLGEQINRFRDMPNLVRAISLNSVGLAENKSGEWAFSLTLGLSKNFFVDFMRVTVPEEEDVPIVDTENSSSSDELIDNSTSTSP